MDDTFEVPTPNPLPLAINTPGKKMQWAYHLRSLMEMFRGEPTEETPAWLIDAVFDLSGDPDLQHILSETVRQEGEVERMEVDLHAAGVEQMFDAEQAEALLGFDHQVLGDLAILEELMVILPPLGEPTYDNVVTRFECDPERHYDDQSR